MMSRVVLAAVALAALAACNPPTPSASPEQVDPGPVAGDPTVVVSDMAFAPDRLTVEAGTTASWVFDDNMPHNVVGDGFASEVMQTGAFTHTFTDPGSYPYFCTLHPNMEGTVVVVDG
jgi:plastocyanin